MKELSTVTTQTISHIQLAEMTGKRQDNVKRLIENLAFKNVISFTQFEEKGKGRPLTVFSVNERDSYVVIAQLCPIYTARLVDFWIEQIPFPAVDALVVSKRPRSQVELRVLRQ